MAKFHAVSLAAKFRDPLEFNKAKSTLVEWLITKENPYLSSGVDNGIQMSSKVVENQDSYTVQKLRTIVGRGYEVLSSLIVPSEPLAVVVHGDLWCNNLLFRYQPWTSGSKTPRDVCFLDLQVSRYGSPSMDILYFLFTSSSSGVLNQHFHYLMSEYHKTLSDHLVMLAPQAPFVALEDIKGDLRKHSVFGLLLSLLVLPAVTAENKLDLDDMSEELLQDPSFQEQVEKNLLGPGYKRRVNEIFEFCDRENLI